VVSWVERKAQETIERCDWTPLVTAQLVRALREAVEEAARRVRDTDQEEAKGDTYYAQLGDAAATREACAKAVEAMLTDEADS
jgi:hypothetical protein